MAARSGLLRIFTASRPLTAGERLQLAAFSTTILLLHVVGWGVTLFVVAPRYPFMIGLAGLAYSFGFRHAFDADHIAAIDSTTRKLMTSARRPYGVGFFFSLGHSTVVFVLTLAVAVAARTVTIQLPRLREVGSLVGATVSGLFLFAIGVVNLVMLVEVVRVLRAYRADGANREELEARLAAPAWLTRWFGTLFRLVSRPRQMYLVGLLFGLGFDTATEVALLTTAGVAASQALPLLAVLMLPVVFAAGMTLMDTADGIVMCGTYEWAAVHPIRKLFYNVTITGLSVLIALGIGAIELVSVVSGRVLGIHTGVWGMIQELDVHAIGYVVVALFIAVWMVSVAVWRFGGWDAEAARD